MQQTIFTILTNKQTREARIVEKILDKEFTVGVPWFDKVQAGLPEAKTALAKQG